MIKHLLVALMLSMVIIGCDSRYGGPIYPVPHIPDERPAVPSDSQVMTDLQDVFGQIASVEIESEIISVDSRVYIVIVDKDSESPIFYKVTYYLLDGEWVCIPEQIEM
jgi:hypothetical protein